MSLRSICHKAFRSKSLIDSSVILCVILKNPKRCYGEKTKTINYVLIDYVGAILFVMLRLGALGSYFGKQNVQNQSVQGHFVHAGE